MSPALNGSSAIRRFKHSNAIETRDGITFDFYTGLQPVCPELPLSFDGVYETLNKAQSNLKFKIILGVHVPCLVCFTLRHHFLWNYKCIHVHNNM